MNAKFLLFALLSTRLADAAEDAPVNRADSTIVLDEVAVKNLRIETVEAEETDFEETIFALGRIEVLPEKRAVASTRIEGRAQRVIARADMKCEAGDELLWIESRQPALKDEDIPVRRVDAPIGGIIAKVNVAQGQPVGPDDSLVEIYDLSMVEALAAVPEHFAGKLVKDLEAHIRVPGFPDKTWDAKLAHVGANADAASGTVEAAFHVANDDDLLRPGMRAEFSIVISKRENVQSIPRTALQGDDLNRFVYRKDYELENTFVKIPVVTGEQNDRFVEILEGLLPGDEVVTRGAYALAFAGKGSISLKEALDAAHGHPHNEDGSEMTAEQRAAAAAKESGGHDHEHEEGSGGLFWKITSGMLFLLLIVATFFPRRIAAGVAKPEGGSQSV